MSETTILVWSKFQMCENKINFFGGFCDRDLLYRLGSFSANKYQNAVPTAIKSIVFHRIYRSNRMFCSDIFKEQISLEL